MSIHPEHPFATPDQDRSPLRRLRGRLPAPVSVWSAAAGPRRAGWTVSSFLLADGQPGEVLGLVDEDSDLAGLLTETSTVVVNLLSWSQRTLADVFAESAPAPGGVFRTGAWTATAWGPALADGAGWVGARLRSVPAERAGWGLLVRAVVEHVQVGPAPAAEVLTHVHGRYRRSGDGQPLASGS